VSRVVSLLAAAAALSLGCGSSLPVVGEAGAATLIPRTDEAAFGQVVRLRGPRAVVIGELLACERDRVYLRVRAGDVRWVELLAAEWPVLDVVGSDQYSATALWSSGGFLSTASHGVWLVVSAPVWAVAGGVSIGSAGPPAYATRGCPATVRAFARWPQGLPSAMAPRFERLDADLRALPAPRPVWSSGGAAATSRVSPSNDAADRPLPAPWDAR